MTTGMGNKSNNCDAILQASGISSATKQVNAFVHSGKLQLLLKCSKAWAGLLYNLAISEKREFTKEHAQDKRRDNC